MVEQTVEGVQAAYERWAAWEASNRDLAFAASLAALEHCAARVYERQARPRASIVSRAPAVGLAEGNCVIRGAVMHTAATIGDPFDIVHDHSGRTALAIAVRLATSCTSCTLARDHAEPPQPTAGATAGGGYSIILV